MQDFIGELAAVSVGNTRTRAGLFRAGALEMSSVAENSDAGGVAAMVLGLPAGDAAAPVVLASVNEPFTRGLEERLAPELGRRGSQLLRLGRDLPIPISTTLEDDSTVGQDRLLNALGAYSRAKQACIVVDAGTAVTVDFVDGEGVFHGGAIGPGLNMMLAALHEHTAALPRIAFEPVGPETVFGKDTRRAMLLGVQAAARGMVRVLAERYSEHFGAYPQIIATGGDARVLFENDDLVEHIVPDLTLLGIDAACRVLTDESLDEPEP